MSKHQVVPAVKAAIFNERGEFLVIQQKIPGGALIWDFPGGRVPHGEDPSKTLVREVKEEVGLHVKKANPLGMYYFVRTDGIQVVITLFLCEVRKRDKIQLEMNPEEAEDIKSFIWVSKKAFLSNIDIVDVNGGKNGGQSLEKLIRGKFS